MKKVGLIVLRFGLLSLQCGISAPALTEHVLNPKTTNPRYAT
jgi:hypothetical protein